MKIVICSSLDFVSQIKSAAEQLKALGHAVVIPKTAEMILADVVTNDAIQQEKKDGGIIERMIRQDSIRYYYENIKACDAILVLNLAKKGIKNYIGGAVFLEIGFAHVHHKKIFLLNDVPDVSFKDELLAMQPIVISGDFSKIQ